LIVIILYSKLISKEKGESPLEILESFSERLSDEETKKEFDKILDFFCKHGLNYD